MRQKLLAWISVLPVAAFSVAAQNISGSNNATFATTGITILIVIFIVRQMFKNMKNVRNQGRQS